MNRLDHNKKEQAEFLAKWAEEKMGLTATYNKHMKQDNADPCRKELSSVDDFKLDKMKLVDVCQMHKCSTYCLPHPNRKRRLGTP